MITKIIDTIVMYFWSKILTYPLYKWLMSNKYSKKEKNVR